MDPTGIPSIGDVLLLSQLAWRIGYAFAASRPSAPTQFYDIEIELKTLTKSLDLLAEALDDDNSILVHADDRAKAGVNKTLFNCQQSLEDLNAFMARYQELKSPESEVGTRGIQAVKTWKPLLLKNWRSVWWTTDGGDILCGFFPISFLHNEALLTEVGWGKALRNMLHSHVNSVNSIIKALQSRSLPHLAQTVESAILRLDQVQSLASDTTNVTNQVDPEEEDNPTYSSNELADSTTDHPSSTDDLTSYDPSHTCASSPGDSSDGYLMESNTKFSVEVTQNYSPSATRGHSAPSYPPDINAGPPVHSANAQAQRRTSDWESNYISEDHISVASNAQSSPARANIYGEPPQSPSLRQYEAPPWSSHTYPTPLLDRTSSQVSSEHSIHETPPTSPPLDISVGPEVPPAPEIRGLAVNPNRAMTTVSQQEKFKREMFRDTAILCEVPGLGVEYARRGDEGGTVVVKIISECQIVLLRKRDAQSDGNVKFVTSIWVISDDRTIRMQQELTDGEEVIPYTVWGSTEKVSLRVSTRLRFHGTHYKMKTLDMIHTNYTNYVFKDEQGANHFQSAIMGKTLLLSVQTNRTLRVHEGIAGTFAYQEQMCALENLRIWKDQDSNGVLAMIHYTPQFRDGYMTFYCETGRAPGRISSFLTETTIVNSQRDRVRVTDVDNRVIKLKGLNISIEKPGSHRRRRSITNTPTATTPTPTTTSSSSAPQTHTSESQQHPQRLDPGGDSGGPGASVVSKGSTTTKAPKPPKRITGARLEFTAESDKRLFLEKFREVQGFFYAG